MRTQQGIFVQEALLLDYHCAVPSSSKIKHVPNGVNLFFYWYVSLSQLSPLPPLRAIPWSFAARLKMNLTDIAKARAEAAGRAARLVWTAVVISADYKLYDILKVPYTVQCGSFCLVVAVVLVVVAVVVVVIVFLSKRRFFAVH